MSPRKRIYKVDEIDNADLSSVEIISEFKYPHPHLPSQIFKLTHLKRLELKFGYLKDIPDEISGLIDLKELYLQANQIGRISYKLAQLERLKRLRLFDNKINDISPICFIPNLFELEIGRNEIKSIPDEIKNLKNLRKLDLGNIFYSNAIVYISDQIGLLNNLERLSIHGAKLPVLNESIGDLVKLKNLSITNSQVKEIGFDFNQLQDLEVLDFTNNEISNFFFDFSKAENLKSVYLANNPIKDIPESILNLPKIRMIGISGTKIDQDSIIKFTARYPNIKFLTAHSYFSEIFQSDEQL